MSQPRLKVGEHGVISCTQTEEGAWVARTRQRGVDGIVRNRRASGRTKKAATRVLHALLAGPPVGVGEHLTGDSTIEQLATAWLTEERLREEIGTEAYDYYRRGVETLIIPNLGDYRVNELRPVTIRQFYTRLLTSVGPDDEPRRTPSRPIWAHKVLSQMLRYAVEVGAIDHNPTTDLQPQSRGIHQIRPLDVELFHEIRAAVTEYDNRPQRGPRRSHRLLTILDLLATSGARISELLALQWSHIDLDSTPVTVTISGTLLPPRDGLPLRRKEGTKSPAGMRQITIPPFAVETLQRLRTEAATPAPNAPVFTNRNGTWLSPGNIRREWRQCRSGRDWDWVTPHTFRTTVATLIDDHYSNPQTGGTEGAGAPIAAAILGHSSETVTRTFYIKKMRRTPDVSTILQHALANPPEANAS